MQEKFIMVDMTNAKQLGQVMQNQTCMKILDLLTDSTKTATQLSKSLSLPLSTIHHNIQQLKKANLVTDDEFTYSEKGRKIIHYGLAEKYILIAPRKTSAETLRTILPGISGVFIGALIIALTRPKPATDLAMESMAMVAPGMASDVAMQTAPSITMLEPIMIPFFVLILVTITMIIRSMMK